MTTHTIPLQPTRTFHNATRINRSLTASAEKRLLIAMATRLPRCITSDQLTLLGFLAQIAAGACFALARHHRLALLGVTLCIALNWCCYASGLCCRGLRIFFTPIASALSRAWIFPRWPWRPDLC